MTQIIGTNKQSKCMYCDQQTYGKNCPYSPSRAHVHIDDPKRCIYCGHTGFGTGCPYNPAGRVHVHGVEFNNAVAESVDRLISSQIFITRLSRPIEESAAFKLGLVDKEGSRIRPPETDEDKAAFTPIDAYIFRLRRMLGEHKIKLLNSSVILEMLSNNKKPFDRELHENEIKLRERIAQLVYEFTNIMIDGSQTGFSMDEIEKMFTETICYDSNN